MSLQEALTHYEPQSGETAGFISKSDAQAAITQIYDDITGFASAEYVDDLITSLHNELSTVVKYFDLVADNVQIDRQKYLEVSVGGETYKLALVR